jgi:FkbH-like protein
MRYNEIIKLNNELEKQIQGEEYKVAILSNIMIHQSKEICEYLLRAESINANIFLGGYDNIVQDSSRFQDTNAIIIFWEIYNIVDGFHYKIDNLKEAEFKDFIQKIKVEIDLVLSNLDATPLILINKFSSLIFGRFQLSTNRLSQITSVLNQYLEEKNNINIRLIDIDKVISHLSISASVDLRYYYSSKALYSINFYKKYFEYVKPIFLSVTGKIKKALIFDCDNTLWKGVLGEDGFDGIKMFQEVQYLALNLSKKGVIVGLCSKNNAIDIDNVLENHPDMILKEGDIVIKKINWRNKVSNLKHISQELNIGLDSIVFIDDSSFEVELIKKELPEISVFQVPVTEYEYGLMIREVGNLFYNPSQTKEDVQKSIFYKERLVRCNDKTSIESYLKTLDLTIDVFVDDLSQISRISQMTQKTNQFNLTTKRYTENEIKGLINSKSHTIITIKISDKYGDNGITGLAILDFNELQIDTLLLSCRILGRNIEYKFMDIIVNLLTDKGIKKINSQYIKTMKNQQVSNYYSRLGFNIIGKLGDNLQYRLNINNYKNKDIKYIKVRDEKQS